jgi:hypothetical protein
MGVGATTKGYLLKEPTNWLMPFQFNPEGFEYGYGTDYAVVKPPGSPHPLYQFVGGNERYITLSLFLDGREKRNSSIKNWQSFMGQFHPINYGTGFHPTPVAIFAMGPFVKRVIIRDVNWRFTMFDKNLNPIRAELEISMETVI